MTTSLADALSQVDLEPGRVYQCQVGRFRVVLCVEETASQLLPTPLGSADVMLDPWTDLPAPQPSSVVQVIPGSQLLPDLPELPGDDQY